MAGQGMDGMGLVLDRYEWLTLGIDFLVFAAFLAIMGRLIGLASRVQSRRELSVRDNAAFGLSFAASIVSLAIVMSGAVSGETSVTLVHEAIVVAAYGALGIVLLLLARHVFDRYALPLIDLADEIGRANVAAAAIDAANMVSTAIVIRAVMIWVDTDSLGGLALVLAGFVFSQFVMFVVTRYRQAVYRRRHDGARLQEAFRQGNLAAALRYFGHRLGASLAITAASGIVAYDAGRILHSAALWGLASLAVVVAVSLLSIGLRLLILPGIDIGREVGRQRNIAVGLTEGAIYLALGLVMAALFALPAD